MTRRRRCSRRFTDDYAERQGLEGWDPYPSAEDTRHHRYRQSHHRADVEPAHDSL